ncbi:hypothetical protein RhiirC2_794576 [Rhizophagus irregularis]|uniref:Uncharacterized protein n=1 Tax=Rhizophagus irregularis TaxID=588596 RepID=A0A2N1MDA1_9GLOM|nr:hypothetical protein RhiirC2_794576 [Rhizophagus irregularis]
MPKMWCSCVHYSFKKLLEYNPEYFSKNRFIQMIEISYIDGKFKAGRRLFHIYCTVCLVIICENTIECGNDHLKKCIARTAKKRVSILGSDEIEKIYHTYCFIFRKGLNNYTYKHSNEIKKRIVNRLTITGQIYVT